MSCIEEYWKKLAPYLESREGGNSPCCTDWEARHTLSCLLQLHSVLFIPNFSNFFQQIHVMVCMYTKPGR